MINHQKNMINHQELETQLSELPSKIREAELSFIDTKETTEKAKLKLKIAHALALVKTQASNATEKKSQADIKTQQESEELIDAEIEMAKKEAELTFLQNKFTAVRKIGSLETELIKTNLSGF